ncbi:hypothetical protein AWB69_01205 [Caballeronia udeis]|uniref:Uncharacterized protein n=1 Tax=Caballeronia udeis TaxID=1232866 RepID=A0A158FIE0_9BURK|nr:hypothetical protein AWB69_01205 [Caballeronia udeis]
MKEWIRLGADWPFTMHGPKTYRQVLRDNVGRVNAEQTVYLKQSKRSGHLRKALCNRWIYRR